MLRGNGDPLRMCDGLIAPQPATCSHRCACVCHIRPGEVKHQVGCCTSCGRGHTRIDPIYLQDHLRVCHLEL